MQPDNKPRTSFSGRQERLWLSCALKLLLIVTVLGTMLIGMLGCDPKTKHHVLSFFFDGVPPLPGMPGYGAKPIIGPGGLELDPDDPRAIELLARDRARKVREKARAKEVVLFEHKPYSKRQCMACHDKNKSFSASVSETCQGCHKEYYDTQWNDWVHGPVAIGKCSMCHQPHNSKHKGLLTKKARDLCLACHDEARTMAGAHHVEAAFKPCSTCHDPHFAGNRHLLPDAFSYQRRMRSMKIAPDKHAAWDRDTCTKCHSSTRSNAVIPGAEKMCLTCHDKVQHPVAGKKIHDPVLKGKCFTCHTAHNSRLPHLLKTNAEANCTGCHKTEKLSKPKHSRFYRVDCLICHGGHSSPRKHLLRVPDQAPRATTRPTSRPTTMPSTMPATTRPATTTEIRP
jgi:predicted CXXCH cytochrome family protein